MLEAPSLYNTKVDQNVANCFFAEQIFSEACTADKISDELLIKISKENPCARGIFLEKKNLAKYTTTSLRINFFENRLITSYQGKELSIKLSCALGIISELSEIFAKIQSATKLQESEKDLSIESQFANVLDIIGSSESDVQLTANEKVVIAIYPLKGRVVLSTSGRQSSTPMEMIKGCAHLFNIEFAREICPLLCLDQNVSSLLNGINKLYLGRRILGLGKSIAAETRTQIGHERELDRIVSLIKMPGSAFYTEPLL